ncbi:MAG TPA: preprotein translocase subunit SecE [Candidatus Saccharimonadales bacterium]|nr:preprotein translocase subunit SecE [Candidatus Saccharimonadales bacterium]
MALNPFAYIKESKEELDKVIWPTRAETIRLTLIVLGVSIIVGAYVSGIDAIMAKIAAAFLAK